MGRCFQDKGYIYMLGVVRCNQKSVILSIAFKTWLAFGVYTLERRWMSPLLKIGLLCLGKLLIKFLVQFKHCLGKQGQLWLFTRLLGTLI